MSAIEGPYRRGRIDAQPALVPFARGQSIEKRLELLALARLVREVETAGCTPTSLARASPCRPDAGGSRTGRVAGSKARAEWVCATFAGDARRPHECRVTNPPAARRSRPCRTSQQLVRRLVASSPRPARSPSSSSRLARRPPAMRAPARQRSFRTPTSSTAPPWAPHPTARLRATRQAAHSTASYRSRRRRRGVHASTSSARRTATCICRCTRDVRARSRTKSLVTTIRPSPRGGSRA